MLRTTNSMRTELIPRMRTCRTSGRAGSMNCGRMAVKKINALGLAPCVTTASEKDLRSRRAARARPQEPDDCGAAVGATWLISILAPSHTRYAAPAHLITTNTCQDATSTAPRLVADNAK